MKIPLGEASPTSASYIFSCSHAGTWFPNTYSEDQLDDYQVLFDNHRRLKELVAELEALSLTIVDADPRWKS